MNAFDLEIKKTELDWENWRQSYENVSFISWVYALYVWATHVFKKLFYNIQNLYNNYIIILGAKLPLLTDNYICRSIIIMSSKNKLFSVFLFFAQVFKDFSEVVSNRIRENLCVHVSA